MEAQYLTVTHHLYCIQQVHILDLARMRSHIDALQNQMNP